VDVVGTFARRLRTMVPKSFESRGLPSEDVTSVIDGLGNYTLSELAKAPRV